MFNDIKTRLQNILPVFLCLFIMLYPNILIFNKRYIDFTTPKSMLLNLMGIFLIPFIFLTYKKISDKKFLMLLIFNIINIFIVSLFTYNKDSLFGTPFPQLSEGIFAWFGYLFLLVLGIVYLNTEKEQKMFIRFSFYGMLFNSFYGLYNLYHNITVFGFFETISENRIYGTAINAVAYSNVLLIFLIIGLWGYLKFKNDSRTNIIARILIVLSTLFIFLTFSRNTLLSMAILYIVFFIYLKKDSFKIQLDKKNILILFGVIFLLGLLFILRLNPEILKESISERLILWNNGMELIQERPFGYGTGLNQDLFGLSDSMSTERLQNKDMTSIGYSFFKAHNVFIDYIMIFGFQGFLLLFLLFYKLFKNKHDIFLKISGIIYLLALLTYYTDIYSTPLIFLLMGIAIIKE